MKNWTRFAALAASSPRSTLTDRPATRGEPMNRRSFNIKSGLRQAALAVHNAVGDYRPDADRLAATMEEIEQLREPAAADPDYAGPMVVSTTGLTHFFIDETGLTLCGRTAAFSRPAGHGTADCVDCQRIANRSSNGPR